MAGEETLDETEERVLAYLKSYDFEKYGWSTPEAAAELGLPVERVYQALHKIQRVKRGEVFLYFKDGALRVQTE